MIIDNAHLLHQKTLYLLAADTKCFVESHQYLGLAEKERKGDSVRMVSAMKIVWVQGISVK